MIVLNDKFLTEILLADRTTKKNIIWATNDYKNISATDEIKFEQIDLIQPRYKKIRELQKSRAKNKAEIFTPTFICEKQNNSVDESFGKIFWQDYIQKKILEITCGEAPYIANRYDAVTGENISIENRVGMLDRKLKLVGENTKNPDDWFTWAKKSVQSVYGYEFQGDNLFLARKNILQTVEEFFLYKFGFDVYISFLKDVAEIISWNFWQMDGRNFSVPLIKRPAAQQNLFGEEFEDIPCKIMDWETNEKIIFKNLGAGKNEKV